MGTVKTTGVHAKWLGEEMLHAASLQGGGEGAGVHTETHPTLLPERTSWDRAQLSLWNVHQWTCGQCSKHDEQRRNLCSPLWYNRPKGMSSWLHQWDRGTLFKWAQPTTAHNADFMESKALVSPQREWRENDQDEKNCSSATEWWQSHHDNTKNENNEKLKLVELVVDRFFPARPNQEHVLVQSTNLYFWHISVLARVACIDTHDRHGQKTDWQLSTQEESLSSDCSSLEQFSRSYYCYCCQSCWGLTGA